MRKQSDSFFQARESYLKASDNIFLSKTPSSFEDLFVKTFTEKTFYKDGRIQCKECRNRSRRDAYLCIRSYVDIDLKTFWNLLYEIYIRCNQQLQEQDRLWGNEKYKLFFHCPDIYEYVLNRGYWLETIEDVTLKHLKDIVKEMGLNKLKIKEGPVFKNSDIVDEIIDTLKADFNGKLDCKKEKADLYVYLNGQEMVIDFIDTEDIHFSNGEKRHLLDADIQNLVYINHVLQKNIS